MKECTMRYAITAALITISVISFLSISATVFARDKLIAVTEIWPPFRIQDDSKKHRLTGIDIDIIEGLEEFLNLEIEIIRCPYARALDQIKNGEADIITGVAFTKRRSGFIDYIYPSYFTVGPVFYTQKGRGHLVKNYDDLKKYEVGYSLHSAYFEPFDSDLSLKKVGISTEEQLLKMVAMGRLDLIVGTNPNLQYDIKKYGLEDKLEQAQFVPQKTTPIFLGVSKGHKNEMLKSKIEEYLRKIIANGTLVHITTKYE